MHASGLCFHLCPQEYVRVILRGFFKDTVPWLFPSCWLCLPYGVDVRGQIGVQLGEGNGAKVTPLPCLSVQTGNQGYLLPVLTAMRAVG